MADTENAVMCFELLADAYSTLAEEADVEAASKGTDPDRLKAFAEDMLTLSNAMRVITRRGQDPG